MPVVDVEIVGDADGAGSPAQALADALGAVFASPAGRTWVRVRRLAADAYAENALPVQADALPVFVSVLHAHPPSGAALAAQAAAVTAAVARVLGRDPVRVHVQFAPVAAGRQAFGGRLVE